MAEMLWRFKSARSYGKAVWFSGCLFQSWHRNEGAIFESMMAHPIRYALYSLLPKATLSRWTGRLLSAQLPLISPLMKRLFVAIYKPNLDEAEHTISHYPTAQALFTRRLKPGARPLADGELISPVDGCFRFSGEMATSPATLIQAKGIEYTLPQLIGDQ